MASFNAVGFDEMEKMLLQQSEAVDKIAPDMLKAGAEILIAAQKSELRRVSKGDQSIGTLANSIGAGAVKKSRTSIYINVYPQGQQPHGTPRKGKRGSVSNAQVGFTLEYGHTTKGAGGKGVRTVPPKPWLSTANAKSAEKVQEAMRKVWEEKQNG